ncbi:uncharacterized protein LOC123554800 isoform X2 [Mercenaria mercenaria]|nr:uncharacterized protein LOC123554800 isoform X2 [Mercenaria mercenaria]
MQQSYTLDDNSLDDGQYGPALPKSSAKSKAVSNKDSIGPVLPTTKELTQVIGPVLPPIYSSDSDADSVSSSERGQHPSFPHSFECVKSENKTEESDDDMIGPSAGLQALEQDLSAEVESRSLKMKEKLMSSSTPDEVEAPKQRESWMTELPEEMGASFGLGNRQFRTRAAPEQDSSWTEAPHEKGKKSKDEKKRKKDKYDNFQSDKEKKAAKEIEAYNKKHRPESLLEMHKKEMKKKKEARFLSESIAQRYFKQLHSAIDYIHSQGYAHRDICPQNVLISQNNVPKLCDFGHAVRFMASDPLCEDDCGSLGYQAPQILEKTPFNPKQADIWSLGALLYSVCTGHTPLGTIRGDVIQNASKEIPFPDVRILALSREFKSLSKGMLAYKPETRFTMNRIAHSPWMTKTDTRVQIGGFFRARQPQKTSEGSLEQQIKSKLKI